MADKAPFAFGSFGNSFFGGNALASGSGGGGGLSAANFPGDQRMAPGAGRAGQVSQRLVASLTGHSNSLRARASSPRRKLFPRVPCRSPVRMYRRLLRLLPRHRCAVAFSLMTLPCQAN